MPDNIPDRHHYLPQFYLSRWAGDDGKLAEFSIPNPASGIVVPKRRAPKGTGFENGIYNFANMPPEKRSLIETRLMHRIDTDGARALTFLERDPTDRQWSGELRQAWVVFMISMFIRNPVDIEALKAKYAFDWRNTNDQWEAEYQQQRRAGDPASADEYFNSFEQHQIENLALNLLPKLIDLPKVGRKLLNMHWFVVRCASEEEFLTSDRPIAKTHLDRGDAYWMMPIGPDRLFLAVHSWQHELQIRSRMKADQLVIDANETVAGRAVKYAYGRTDRQLDLVQKQLAKHPAPSVFEQRHLGV